MIQTDVTTTLNNGSVAGQFVAKGVTAGCKIYLGGGNDTLTLGPGTDSTSAPVDLSGALADMSGPLSIQTGAGSGKVSISDFHFSKLSVSSTGDASVDISDSNVNTSVVLQGQLGSDSRLADGRQHRPPARLG